jgi:hypothetical protein
MHLFLKVYNLFLNSWITIMRNKNFYSLPLDTSLWWIMPRCESLVI